MAMQMRKNGFAKEARSGEFRDSQIMRTAWEQLAKVCAADVC